MKPKAIFCLLALFPAFKCTALEPGTYLLGPKAEELHKVLDSADRTIACHGEDEFLIGVQRTGQELSFSLWDLSPFLREEKHKDCLVLDTGKGWAPDRVDEKEKRKQFVDKLVSSFSKYGYRRILVIERTNGGAIELLADVTPQPSKHLMEPGFCTAGSERAKELEALMDSADREIECDNDDDKFSTKAGRGGQEQNFTLSELDAFLRKEKHKDCLVVWTQKRKVPGDEDERKEERKRFTDKWVQLFSKYGYRRIVVIGGLGSGYDLLADLTPEPSKPAPNK